jgi:ATP-dependent DNA ligase
LVSFYAFDLLFLDAYDLRQVPKLVAQIGFTEWMGDGKLRQPRFQGLRDDKNAEEVTRDK